MRRFSRTDTSRLAEWWWTVDRWMLSMLLILIGIGLVMIFAAGPAAAGRMNISNSWHFVIRQLVFLGPALVLLLGASLLDVKQVKRLALLAYGGALVMVVLTYFFSPEVNGARRWIYLAGFSLQPSEFIKPTFAIVAASLIAQGKRDPSMPGHWIALALFGLTAALVLGQKDFGQTALLSLVFGAQLFIAGLPIIVALGLGIAGIGGIVLAYLFLPHVTSRFDRFLNPATGDTYQVDRAQDAFAAGGLLGRGPGEGVVKSQIPDAHTDYIFAVAGEEFGALICLVVIGIYAVIVLRGLNRSFASPDHFVQLAASGLIIQFGLQAIINMAVNLDLAPSKGMTLPFISYGGSSLLALALSMGLLLALTREHVPGLHASSGLLGRKATL